MAGLDKQYVPCTMINASLVYDLRYVLMGGFLSFGPHVEVVVDPAPEGKYGYRQLLLMHDVVVGGTFIEDRRHYLAYRQLMQTRTSSTGCLTLTSIRIWPCRREPWITTSSD